MDKNDPQFVCAFTGHRPHNLPWGYDETDSRCIKLKELILSYTVYLIEHNNVFHFISGMAQGTDIYAAEIVLKLKKHYRNITLECALPCRDQAKNFSKENTERYERILHCADLVSYIRKEYSSTCMQERNIYMVNRAEYLIAVWDGRSSGTANTIEYAKELNRKILIIEPNTFKLYRPHA